MNYKKALEEHHIFKVVAESAEKLGLKTFVVGGWVRDLLLNRDSKDIDFVCVGSGIALAKSVSQKLQGSNLTVFRNFGTAMVKFGEAEYEFVGARKESYRRDSRKPLVEDGTLEDDQKRRDFTINAMAFSLNKDTYGDLIDPFKGTQDLQRKIIRTPLNPDRTFSDDPLRMMRAVRFASQLNFDIEPDTFESLVNNASRLEIISAERIVTELNKIISSQTPSYGFNLLFHSKLLHQFFPEMVALQGVEHVEGRGHKDNFYHTLKVLDNTAVRSKNLWLRWAAIMHDIAKPITKRYDKRSGWTFHGHEEIGARMVPKLFRRLKLPMDHKMKYVQKLVRLHLRPIALVKKEITDSAVRRLIFEAGDDIDDLMLLCRADITSKNPDRVNRYLSNFDRVEEKIKQVEEKDRLRNFQPPISGDEIIEYFGIPPGRIVGEIKEAIKEAILEGKIENDRTQAWDYMQVLGKEKGLVSTINGDN
jgi:putative nucleotidyltransferase with HDIG domain